MKDRRCVVIRGRHSSIVMQRKEKSDPSMIGTIRTSFDTCDVRRVPLAPIGEEVHQRRTTVASTRHRRLLPSETRTKAKVVVTSWPYVLVDPGHPVRRSSKRQVIPQDANLRNEVSMGVQQTHSRDTFESQATTFVRVRLRQIAPICRFYGTDRASTAPNHLLVRPIRRLGTKPRAFRSFAAPSENPQLHHVLFFLRRGLSFDPRPSTVCVHVHEASTCRTVFPTRDARSRRIETIGTFHPKDLDPRGRDPDAREGEILRDSSGDASMEGKDGAHQWKACVGGAPVRDERTLVQVCVGSWIGVGGWRKTWR